MRRTAVGLLLILTGLMAAAAPVGAQAGEAEVVIVEVDTTRYTDDGRVTMVAELRNLDAFVPEDLILTENGVVVSDFTVDTVEESIVDVGVILAIDVSGSMNDGALDAAKAAAIDFVNQKKEQDSIALVTFGDSVEVLVSFTRNARSITTQIADLVPSGSTAFYDAMVQSADLYRGPGADLQPHVIALTDGADEGSVATLEEAIAALTLEEVRVFGIAIESADFQGEPLQEIASSTRGLYLPTTDPENLQSLYDQIRSELNNKIVIRFNASQPLAGVASFGLEYQGLRDGQNAEVPGFVVPERLAPTSTTLPFFEEATGQLVESTLPASITTLKLLAAIGVGVGLLLLAFILFGVAAGEDGTVAGRLRSFERPTSPTLPSDKPSLLQRLPLFRRLSDQAEQATRERGLFHSVDSALDRANISLRPGEAIALALLISVIVGALVGALTQNLLLGVLVSAVAVLLVFALTRRIGDRERKRFENQLPDTLTLLATSLRAGYSLLQAVEAVKEEAPEPTAREFSRAIVEIRLGRQVVDALRGVAERTQSMDFEWTVMAIEIQREVGGNLSEVLSTVADTMLQRNRLRREVRALTAEGRISMIIMVALPFAVIGMMLTLSPGYLDPLVSTVGGLIAVGLGVVTMVLGVLWMRKIVDITL